MIAQSTDSRNAPLQRRAGWHNVSLRFARPGEGDRLQITQTAMADDDFRPYSQIADQLIERTTKDQIADVARLRALNIGYYHKKYGDVPKEELLRLVRAETLDERTAQLLLHGMQNLVSALTEVMGVTLQGGDEQRH